MENTLSQEARLLIETFHFLEVAAGDESRQIGFERRPLGLPIFGGWFRYGDLKGSRFDELDAGLEKQICQMPAQPRIRALSAE